MVVLQCSTLHQTRSPSRSGPPRSKQRKRPRAAAARRLGEGRASYCSTEPGRKRASSTGAGLAGAGCGSAELLTIAGCCVCGRRFAAEIPRVSLTEPSAGVADGATELRTNTLAALAQALRECWGARRDAGGRGAAGAGSALGGPGEAALQWLARAGTLKAAAVDEIHGGLRGRFGPQQGRDRLAAFREPRRGE